MFMKKTIAIVQIITILFWNGWNLRPLFADDSDIFGNNIAPNVMILLDTSGSMADEVGTLIAYAPATTYSSLVYRGITVNATTVYNRKTSGSVSGQGSCSSSNPCYTVYTTNCILNPSQNCPGVSSASAKNALASSGTWSGSIGGTSYNLRYGNYLNYTLCSSCDGIEPKIDIATRVIANVVNSVDGVRFGLMKLANHSGTVVQPIRDMTTANRTTLVNSITSFNINNLTSVGTPTGDQLYAAGEYYRGNVSPHPSPIQYSCQPNFALVVSDGLQTQYTRSIDTSAAQQYSGALLKDHSTTFADDQILITHTVGFAIGASEGSAAELAANALLQQAATNGGGSFFTTSNGQQLEAALLDAISQIMAATFAFATPVIPTTGTGGSTRAYLASFQSNASRPFWKGYLKAYPRDTNGLIPVDAQGLPSGTPDWDAGNRLSLKTAGSRNIKTYVGGALQDFTTANVTATDLAVTTAPFPLNASDSTDARNKVVNYIRGATDYNDEDADLNTTEARPWKLGDIFHSTPVLVTPPFLPTADSSYAAFKTAQANRAAILLTGANDGMLHAFTEVDGEESWAFIPPNLLDDLKNLTLLSGTRDYYVDSSPIVADVKTGGSWKTIAVFGERRGGNNYYGLDITNTTSPQYLWSFTDANLSETWSEPVIGKVKISDGTDKWVAFVGAGFDTTFASYSGSSKTSEGFFVIDLSNGTKLWQYYNATGSTDDRQYMNFSIPASPTAVDLNNDGYIDRVYIGDVGGQLWKFDLSAPATVSGGLVTNWTGKRLFTAASSQTNPPAAGEFYPTQAIFTPPALAYDPNNNLWVFIGTGDRYHPNNTASNRFYGIKENTTMTNGSTLTESSLTNLTSGSGSVTQGWYIVLNSNEKVLAASDVFDSAVLFTTFTPTTAAVCGSGGGDAKLYAVNMTTGDAAFNLSTGAILSSGQAALAAARSIGSGIPSKPIVIMNPSGNQATPNIVAGTTNQQMSTTPGPNVTIRRVVGWREVF
jgi:type IV pilus assembly protein PilY1